MARVSAAIHIDASREEVWDVATDLGRTGQWVSIHRDFPDGPPVDLRPGSRFRQTLKLAGTKFHVEWTATEVDGPDRLAWDGEGPAGSTAHTSYTLAAADGGTRFSYENEFTLPAGKLGKVAGKAVAGQAERQVNKSLAKLKELVES
jgi:acetyl-CoA C-acetyltransferase